MTRPPKYGQVAEWLRAIDPDAGYLRGLERGYYDIKYAEDNGLTLARYVIEQWRFLAGQARRALDGISVAGNSLDAVAEAYHRKQIAEYAARRRALQQQIRALENGDFEPSRWCADRAAREGISLDQAIEEDRQFELAGAQEELDVLDEQYDVREDEIQGYRATAPADPAAGASPANGTGIPAGSTTTAQVGKTGFPGDHEVINPAGREPALVLGSVTPPASQVAYGQALAEAARQLHAQLAAEAARACAAARGAGWEDRNANNRARAALDKADLALRYRSRAERWARHAAFQASRRTAPARLAATSFPRIAQASAESPGAVQARAPGSRRRAAHIADAWRRARPGRLP